MNILYRTSLFFTFVTFTSMVLLVIIQVILRNTINYSIIWADELSRYLFVWATFIGATAAYRKGEFVTVDLLREKLKGKALRALIVIINVATLVFFSFVCWYGFKLITMPSVTNQISSSLRIPMYYPYAAIPVSASIIIIYSLSNLIGLVRNKTGEQ